MRKKLFPSVKEAVPVLVITTLFLLLTSVCTRLRPEHFLMSGLFLVLFFAGKTTRKLAVALLLFILFGISYDWMRVYPNYRVSPIDVQGLYEAEKSLFGLSVNGMTLIPREYFALNHCSVADFFVGFAGYYIHPAAPPWYAMNYGFEAVLDTPGNAAGLGRFDELLGCSIFHSIYGWNANVFAAMPSLHAAYMVVTLIYAIIAQSKKWLITVLAVIMAGIGGRRFTRDIII